MRTKSMEGWKRRPGAQLCGVNGRKRAALFLLLSMGLLMGVTMRRMHLLDSHDVAPPLTGDGRGVTARLPGTISDEFYFDCDRSQVRTDICNLRGDVRMETRNKSKSFVLYAHDVQVRTEKLKPYTRKWEETGSMSTVNEVTMETSQVADRPECEVRHTVPAVVFSTSGYTGNVYHEFNDGLIPLFITGQHLKREVVLVISSFHDWWYMKYGDVVKEITNYEIVDLERDQRVHCFPEVEAGLHIHGELAVHPERMPNRETIRDFRELLNRAYKREQPQKITHKPRLTIIVRNNARKFMNLEKIRNLSERLGFRVTLLIPDPTTELKKIFWVLNSTDVLLGVHGAAMTHLLFMRPGTVFIQVVPLGTDWAANEYYGEPAVKLGLRYVAYKLRPEESTLSDHYDATDPVLVDPETITQQGWEIVKKIYLDGQDVRPTLSRMREVLSEAMRVVKKSSIHHVQ